MKYPTLITISISAAFLVGAALLSIIATGLARRLAIRLGVLDQPDKRKMHTEPVPYLGGVALYGAFVIYALLLRLLVPESYPPWFLPAIIGGGILTAAGVYDDVKGLSAWIKFPIQIAAALIIYYFAEVSILKIALPFGNWITFGPFTVVVTVLWTVMLINAINLIDGLDGLAAGVVAISCLFMFLMAVISRGDPTGGLLILGLCGVCIGFLRYNFAPARIFMGDAGSMFLGFMLALFSMTNTMKGATVVTLLFPILVLGIPILDTAMAFLRRLSEGKHPFQGDARHIHHRFLAIGLSDMQAVLVIYFFCIALGLFALVMMKLTPAYRILTLGLLVCIILFVILAMGYVERQFMSVLEEVKSYKEWIRFNLKNGNKINGPVHESEKSEAACAPPEPPDDKGHYHPPAISHSFLDKLTRAEEQRTEKVLILSSEARSRLTSIAERLGHHAVAADSAEEMEDLVRQGGGGVFVFEHSAFPDEISDLVVRTRLLSPEATILVLSESSEDAATLGLLRLGAYGILPACANDRVLELLISHALESRFQGRRLKFLHLLFWILIFSIPIWVIIGRFIDLGVFYMQ